MDVYPDSRSFNPAVSNLRSNENTLEYCEDEYYKNDHEKAGYALIFNQIRFDNDETEMSSREGAEIDSLRMERVLGALGFEVKVCNDYKTEEIEKELKEGIKKMFD